MVTSRRYQIVLYLPSGKPTDAVFLFMTHLGRVLEKQGHTVSFIETSGNGAVFRGPSTAEDVDFGIILNSNFPAIKDQATGDYLKQVPIGSFPHLGLLMLPYYFETVYTAVSRIVRLQGVAYFDRSSVPPVLAGGYPYLEPFQPFYYSASPAPSRNPSRKLLYVANIKGMDSVTQIFARFPHVASQSRKLLAMLAEDFTLSIPDAVSEMLDMDYRDWVRQREWRAYAEALQKAASLFDRLNILKALSSYPCHYVLNATEVPISNFHPDSTFSGSIGFDMLVDLYDQYGGIVANLPSRIPNVLSERVTNAMAHGMVPIVPAKGEHMALLSSANSLFYKEKASSLREVIEAFLDLNDEQALSMSRNAHATAIEHFSPEAFATRIVAAYEKSGSSNYPCAEPLR